MSDEERRELGRDWEQLSRDLTEFAEDQTRYANALQANAEADLGRGDREADLRALKDSLTPQSSPADMKALDAHVRDFMAHREALDENYRRLESTGKELRGRKAELDARREELSERHRKLIGPLPGDNS